MNSPVDILNISLKNFRSYSEELFDLENMPSENLIEGINEDDDGMESNGAGKSTIFHALRWNFFGASGFKFTDKDFIKNKETEMEVSVVFVTDKHIYKSTRNQHTSKQILILEQLNKGTWDDISGRTKTMTQDLLLELLGFYNTSLPDASEDFQRMIVLNNDTIDALASKKITPQQRLDFISRLIGLYRLKKAIKYTNDLKTPHTIEINDLTSKINLLKEYVLSKDDLSRYQKKLNNYKTDLNTISVEIEKINKKLQQSNTNKQIEDKAKDIKAEIKDIKKTHIQETSKIQLKIQDLETKLKNLESSDIELKSIKTNEDAIQKEIDSLFIENIQENLKLLKEDKTKYNQQINDLTYTKNELINSIEQLKQDKTHVRTCPSCKAALMVLDNTINLLDIDKLDNQIEDKENQLSEIVRDIIDVSTQLKDVEKDIAKLLEIDTKLSKLEKNLNAIKLTKISLEKDIERISELKEDYKEAKEDYIFKNNKYTTQIDLLKDKLLEINLLRDPNVPLPSILEVDKITKQKEIDNLSTKITSIEQVLEQSEKAIKKINIISVNLDEKNKEIEKLDFWAKHYKIVLNSLVNLHIGEFQELTTQFLRLINSNLSVKFKTHRSLSSGNLKSEFHIIVRDEFIQEDRDIEALSGGERKRIAIAISLAARDIANRNRKTFSLTVLDEIFDGLDLVGKNNVRQLLEKIEGTKFIITHSKELKADFFNTITVIKEKGNSKIINLT